MNNNSGIEYYKIGYLSPRLGIDKINKPIGPICYQDYSCSTKNFSMCRFPHTQYQARLYYPRYQSECSGSHKYLYKV